VGVKRAEKAGLCTGLAEKIHDGRLVVSSSNGRGVAVVDASFTSPVLHLRCSKCKGWHEGVDHVTAGGNVVEWCSECRSRLSRGEQVKRARVAKVEKEKRLRRAKVRYEARSVIRELRKLYVQDRYLMKKYAKRVDEARAPTRKLLKALEYRQGRVREEQAVERLLLKKGGGKSLTIQEAIAEVRASY